ncbi:hypothetical protein ABB27_07385 [Stenotrophomonas terrae]|uniref:Uncharacterized protein n=1 Tax=Stenotrophomonas terrae TaxID=405446 RepID=A0A0R0CFI7_9GAMM|nr:hypothetical protein ABB27_07385 [Stenotrophomonas terrae]
MPSAKGGATARPPASTRALLLLRSLPLPQARGGLGRGWHLLLRLLQQAKPAPRPADARVPTAPAPAPARPG